MQRRLATFLVLLISLAAIYSSITYYLSSPIPSQPFMGIGVYSQSGLEKFVTNSNLTVTSGQALDWTIGVSDRMNRAEFSMIVVRLGNYTTVSANTTTPAGSVPELVAMQQFIGDGETHNFGFNWMFNSTSQSGRLVFLNLLINGQTASGQVQVGAVSGKNFRLIFELWTFDPTTQSFQYGYNGQGAQVGTWLQIWFNASS